MINLALTRSEQALAQERIRRVGMRATSMVFLIWIVVLVSFLGWTWYTGVRVSKSQVDLDQMKIQVGQRADDEVLMRTLAARTKTVNDFLATRGDPLVHLGAVMLATPPAQTWNYKGASNQIMTVKGENLDEINKFVSGISVSYNSVRLTSLKWQSDTGWVGEVQVGGIKQ